MKTFLYWLASLTWGGIMTTIGLLVAIVMLITKHKPYRFGHAICFETDKKGFGGIDLGAIIIVKRGSTLNLKLHEYGHSYQNIQWGILFPFVIGIPSAYRCAMRKFSKKNTFNAIVGSIMSLIFVVCAGASVLHGLMWLGVISIIVLIYTILILCWSVFIETPKYEESIYVPYDSIWFEGQASRFGLRHIKEV